MKKRTIIPFYNPSGRTSPANLQGLSRGYKIKKTGERTYKIGDEVSLRATDLATLAEEVETQLVTPLGELTTPREEPTFEVGTFRPDGKFVTYSSPESRDCGLQSLWKNGDSKSARRVIYVTIGDEEYLFIPTADSRRGKDRGAS